MNSFDVDDEVLYFEDMDTIMELENLVNGNNGHIPTGNDRGNTGNDRGNTTGTTADSIMKKSSAKDILVAFLSLEAKESVVHAAAAKDMALETEMPLSGLAGLAQLAAMESLHHLDEEDAIGPDSDSSKNSRPSSSSSLEMALHLIPVPPTPDEEIAFEARIKKIFKRDSIDLTMQTSEWTTRKQDDWMEAEEVKDDEVEEEEVEEKEVKEETGIGADEDNEKTTADYQNEKATNAPSTTVAEPESKDLTLLLNPPTLAIPFPSQSLPIVSSAPIVSIENSSTETIAEKTILSQKSPNHLIEEKPSSSTTTLANKKLLVALSDFSDSDMDVDSKTEKNVTEFVKLVRTLSKRREKKLAEKANNEEANATSKDTDNSTESSQQRRVKERAANAIRDAAGDADADEENVRPSRSLTRKASLPKASKPKPLKTDIESLMDIYNPLSGSAKSSASAVPSTARTVVTPNTPRPLGKPMEKALYQRINLAKISATSPIAPNLKVRLPSAGTSSSLPNLSVPSTLQEQSNNTEVTTTGASNTFSVLSLYKPQSPITRKSQDAIRLTTLLSDFYPVPPPPILATTPKKKARDSLEAVSQIQGENEVYDSRLTMLLQEYSPSLPTPAHQLYKSMNERIPSPLLPRSIQAFNDDDGGRKEERKKSILRDSDLLSLYNPPPSPPAMSTPRTGKLVGRGGSQKAGGRMKGRGITKLPTRKSSIGR